MRPVHDTCVSVVLEFVNEENVRLGLPMWCGVGICNLWKKKGRMPSL